MIDQPQPPMPSEGDYGARPTALPECVVEVHLFGDNGKPGREAAERAARAYQEQGHRVVLRSPPERFGDFNDLLREEVAA